MEGSDSRRAPRPAETVSKMKRRRLRCAEGGDGRGRFFLSRPPPALALRRACAHLRRNSSKEKSKFVAAAATARQWRALLASSLPPPLSLNTHSLETKGEEIERERNTPSEECKRLCKKERDQKVMNLIFNVNIKRHISKSN